MIDAVGFRIFWGQWTRSVIGLSTSSQASYGMSAHGFSTSYIFIESEKHNYQARVLYTYSTFTLYTAHSFPWKFTNYKEIHPKQ